MSIKELIKKKDGKALRALYSEGDKEAGMAFAQLVFAGKYGGELISDAGETLTKKEARYAIRPIAVETVLKEADKGIVTFIIEASDMFFAGRKEAGPFGSVIVTCDYKQSIKYFKLLLAHKDATNEMLCIANFRLATLIAMTIQDKQKSDWDKCIVYWQQAIDLSGAASTLAKVALARYYYDVSKEYKLAVPILESICEESAGAALLLALAYKDGNGVEKDDLKYKKYRNLWESNA